MLLHSVLLSCFITCVITTKDVYLDRGYLENIHDKTLWPSEGMRLKRQAALLPDQSNATRPLEDATQVKAEGRELTQVSEGGTEVKSVPSSTLQNTTHNKTEVTPVPTPKIDVNKGNASQVVNASSSPLPPPTEKPSNSTEPKTPSLKDLSNPGVMKRGLIVFGGFALVAIAYLIFYRRNTKKSESNSSHGTNDTNQFRYGVLQSDDRRDNLELSRILTVESDEDEDEDLEIFDLEQKKKSLSYVNLQTNDDYVVHGSRENVTDRDNLLLDIEDANSDTLINWSSNGNKSIL